MIVIDSSVALSDVLKEENSSIADAALAYLQKKAVMGIVPAHFPIEYANGLLMAKRRKRVHAEDMPYVLTQWLHMPLEIDTDGQIKNIVALAEKHDLTVYDASYLELALRRDAHLATLDAHLLKAAKKEKVAFSA